MEPKPEEDLTALDWIAAILDIVVGFSLLAVPFAVTPAFLSMFEEFGGQLPAITLFVARSWFPIASGFLVLALTGAGLFSRMPLKTRRALLVAAFFIGLILGAVYLWGMYAPVFELAGAIQE
jgi:type II secretory pathway component PulF